MPFRKDEFRLISEPLDKPSIIHINMQLNISCSHTKGLVVHASMCSGALLGNLTLPDKSICFRMGIIRDSNGRNVVVSKIWEYANSAFGGDKIIIRHTRKNELDPGHLYEWRLYEHETDEITVDIVTIEVSHSEMIAMDDEVQAECARGKLDESEGK